MKAKNRRKRNENVLMEIGIESIKINKENTNKNKDKKNIDLEAKKNLTSKIQQPNNIEQHKVKKKKNDNLSKNILISKEIEIDDKKVDCNVKTFAKSPIKSKTKDLQNTFTDLKENENRKENNENLIAKNMVHLKNKDNFEERNKNQTASLKSLNQTSSFKVLSNITKEVANNNSKTVKSIIQSQKKLNDNNKEKKILSSVKNLQPINLLSSQDGLLTPKYQVFYFYYMYMKQNVNFTKKNFKYSNFTL